MRCPLALEFKIRRRDGLFSTGGCRPRWTKNGKTWTNLGHLKNHLNITDPGVYAGCELVTLEVSVTEVSGMTLKEMFAEGRAKEAAKRARWEARVRAARELHERAQLADLKKKYEGA